MKGQETPSKVRKEAGGWLGEKVQAGVGHKATPVERTSRQESAQAPPRFPGAGDGAPLCPPPPREVTTHSGLQHREGWRSPFSEGRQEAWREPGTTSPDLAHRTLSPLPHSATRSWENLLSKGTQTLGRNKREADEAPDWESPAAGVSDLWDLQSWEHCCDSLGPREWAGWENPWRVPSAKQAGLGLSALPNLCPSSSGYSTKVP